MIGGVVVVDVFIAIVVVALLVAITVAAVAALLLLWMSWLLYLSSFVFMVLVLVIVIVIALVFVYGSLAMGLLLVFGVVVVLFCWHCRNLCWCRCCQLFIQLIFLSCWSLLHLFVQDFAALTYSINSGIQEQMHEFWGNVQTTTDLWLNRTVPRLDLVKEIHSHLEDAPGEDLIQFISVANNHIEDFIFYLWSIQICGDGRLRSLTVVSCVGASLTHDSGLLARMRCVHLLYRCAHLVQFDVCVQANSVI